MRAFPTWKIAAACVTALLFLIHIAHAQTPAPKPTPTTQPEPTPVNVFVPARHGNPNTVTIENADTLRLDEHDIATATGHVKLRYRDYTLTCGNAVIDTKTGVAVLTQNITLDSDDHTASARGNSPDSRLTLKLRQGTYTVENGSGTVAPSQVPNTLGLILPLQLSGGEIQRNPNVIDARDTGVTTCDFPEPHYVFRAQSTTIVPGKRLVARKVSLYRRHKKIITLPYVVLPLNDRYQRGNITPQVGESPEEGYFAKFTEPYVLTAAAVGLLRLDFLQKKGVGTGFEQDYTVHNAPSTTSALRGPVGAAANASFLGAGSPRGLGQLTAGATGPSGRSGQGPGNGSIKFYTLNDRSTGTTEYTGSLTHDQYILKNLRLTAQAQFENNSYLSRLGSSEALNGQVGFTRAVPGAVTTLTSNLQQSSYGFSQTRNLDTALTQSQRLSSTSQATVKFDFGQYGTLSSDGTPGSTLHTTTTNFDYLAQPKGYKIEFLANTYMATQTNTPSGSLSGGVQRLPELTFETVPSIGHALLPHLLPALSKFLFSLGDFDETSSKTHTYRLQYGLDTGTNTKTHRALTNTYSGSYIQSLYGDSTAQYVLQTQLASQYAFQKTSHVGVSYSYLRPYGYTPFLFDRNGSYNTAGATLAFDPTQKVQLNLTSGFDFTRDRSLDGEPRAPWQNVTGQLQLRPNGTFTNVVTGAYDPNKGQLFDVSEELSAGKAGGTLFKTSLDYAPVQHKFATISGSLDLPIIVDKREQAGYRVQALAGYNGFTGQFNYKGFELTRSWHDWELSGIYQDNNQGIQPGGTFYLNFRLKAFPGFQPFAVGAFGQGLDTSIGRVY